ncbi:S8 family serine peptidase [Dactylosporangium sp. CS-033363]|uniref:S8 family serine peptidase n=1 Tax=Dactylosporangium sp. CS-033363 TaxID=3239935 RepID=UPI003D8E6B51
MRFLAALLVAMVVAAVGGAVPAEAEALTVRQQEWWIDALQVTKAHQQAQGEGVTVAVLDTGVDSTQPDLKGALLPGAGTNGVQSSKGWEDPDGHGTQMATVIAGRGGEGNHMLGIAPKAKLLPVAIPIGKRAAAGGRTEGDLAEPIRYAADHGARIISLSFTLDRDEPQEDERAAIAYARQKGAVLVAAGGNRPQGDDRVPLPARYDGVLTVSGTTRTGAFWDGSIADPTVDIAAPAEDIIGAAPKAQYSSGFAVGSGTSGATAITAGVLALIWSKFPQLTADEAVDRLLRTAKDAGAAGRDDQFGAGIIDPLAALTANVPPANAALAAQPRHEQTRQRPWLIPAAAGGLALVLFGVAVPLLRKKRRAA